MPTRKPNPGPSKTRRQPTAMRKIVVSKNGPYLVSGGLPLRKEISAVVKGRHPEKWVKGLRYRVPANYALCRCGRSKNMPFCDGTHTSVGFRGTEKRTHKRYAEMAEMLDGPAIKLADAEALCSSARFCLARGGTWQLTLKSKDPVKRKLAVRQAGNCPSGRLVACDKRTRKPMEPEFEPSISLLEDPQAGVSGPVWVKGRVPVVSAHGAAYEVRNRVTLCRCGKSKNKPFCDSSHVDVGFNDGDESLRG